MKASFVAFLALVAAAAGCSVLMPPMPRTGAVANGQPLGLRESMVTEREHYTEHVGTVTDGEGHTLANIYEDRTLTRHIPVWFGYQGPDYIDAEDFFRIAGDSQNAARVHEHRRLAYIANRGGWIATGVGFGLMIAAAALPDGGARVGAEITGILGCSFGIPAAMFGAKYLAPERHGVDSMSAAMAAQQYNAHLQGTSASAGPRVGVGWRF